MMLGLDLGTTHCKAGVFDSDGTLLSLASRLTPVGRTAEGFPCHDPEALWKAGMAAVRDALGQEPAGPIEAVGVAGMAEAGLLVDRASGAPRTEIIPWFDPRSTGQAEEISRQDDPRSLFQRTGLHSSFKYGLAKILWLRERDRTVVDRAVWLSVADYIVFRLTGRMVTDPTLAARTYAFSIHDGCWDDTWIRHFGLVPSLFPEVLPSGAPAGSVTTEGTVASGLPPETSVSVAGHDHVCALPAAGILDVGPVLDSIGTAESVLGVLPRLDSGIAFQAGLTVVPHVLPGRLCWLGGSPSAGGSLEWLRAQLGEEPLSYGRLDELVESAGPDPTGILYAPYLAGSGAPWHDAHVRASFAGLSAAHHRGHLVKAVLEGTVYEFESIRRAAEGVSGHPIQEIIAVGGGARNRRWLQIKADVSGCTCSIPSLPDATVLGAAMVAALGNGTLGGLYDLQRIAHRYRDDGHVIMCRRDQYRAYREFYEEEYLPFQHVLRKRGQRPIDAAEAAE